MRDLKIFTDNIEQEAIKQIDELLEQKAFKNSKVRIMPDVHAGKGCVIGFTGNLGDKVIPNIVGVDIGCGMLCVELGNIDLDLEKLDDIIHRYIPSGMNVHDKKQIDFDLTKLYCYEQLNNKIWIERSLGTLGGGNHFIEVDIDEDNNKYLIIHSGSRNLGKQVAELYQFRAIYNCSYEEEMKLKKQETIKKLKKEHREQEIEQELNKINKKYKDKVKLPVDLCYLEGKDRDEYLHDMKICQEFASMNRAEIAKRIMEEMFPNPLYKNSIESTDLENTYNMTVIHKKIGINFNYFETIHNYISFEDNIVRKGAISAKKSERVLIPMNMRDGCIIGIGKGNNDWNQSAPHGAGRIMSRKKAKETFNIEEFEKSMKGVYTTSVNENTIDEAPMVYKPMEEILDCIKDTIEVERIIKPIYNYKASDNR